MTKDNDTSEGISEGIHEERIVALESHLADLSGKLTGIEAFFRGLVVGKGGDVGPVFQAKDDAYADLKLIGCTWTVAGEGPIEIEASTKNVEYSDKNPVPAGGTIPTLPQGKWVRINTGKVYVHAIDGSPVLRRREAT